jgi:hypothetical protein
MEMAFISKVAAYDFYKCYAGIHGLFRSRKRKTKSSKGPYKKYVGGGLFFSWKGNVKANF